MLLHVLPGGADVGAELVADPRVPVLSFTGSTAAGRLIGERAGRLLKRAHLELGGNSALVVLEDADVDEAVAQAAWGSFFHQGQICMTTGRLPSGRRGRLDHRGIRLRRRRHHPRRVGQVGGLRRVDRLRRAVRGGDHETPQGVDGNPNGASEGLPRLDAPGGLTLPTRSTREVARRCSRNADALPGTT
jgi:hypothetical protein